MRARPISAFCVALLAALNVVARADPIVATAYLTIGPDSYIGNQTWSGSTTIANPADPQIGLTEGDIWKPVNITIDTSLIPHLSPKVDVTTPFGLFHRVETTYDMRIYFGPSLTPDLGNRQPSPFVEVTGSASGFITDGPPELGFTTTSASFVWKNDNPTSTIPPSLHSLFSKLSLYDYMPIGGSIITVPGGHETEMNFQFGYSPVPEPGSWLLFAATLVGAAIRYRGPRRFL